MGDFDSYIESADDALSSARNGGPNEVEGLILDALGDTLAAIRELARHSSMPRRMPPEVPN